MKMIKRTNKIEFTCHAPQASSVAIADGFNNWNPAETPLRKSDLNGWTATIPLPPT